MRAHLSKFACVGRSTRAEFHCKVGLFIMVVSSQRRNVGDVFFFYVDGRAELYEVDAHRHPSRRSARSSVISVRAQLLEYSRCTRRADWEHCLLLVSRGLEAWLLLQLLRFYSAHPPFLYWNVDGTERLQMVYTIPCSMYGYCVFT